MRNRMRSGLVGACLTCSIPGVGHSFDIGQFPTRSGPHPLGLCTVSYYFNDQFAGAGEPGLTAVLANFLPVGILPSWTGKSIYYYGLSNNNYTDLQKTLTASNIARCLNTTENNITITYNQGADATDWDTQQDMGFGFTINNDDGTLAAGAHIYSFRSTSTSVAASTPTVTLGALTLTSNGTYTSAITLSKAAGNNTVFDASDLTPTNAAVSLSGSDTSFTATLTPTSDGVVSLGVATATWTDAAGNENTAATQVSATYDGTGPTVTLTGPSEIVSGAFAVSAAFTENVTGLTVADINVGNGAASNFVATSAKVYTFNVDPATDGAVTVDIAADAADDGAGNGNEAAEQFSVDTDGTGPTVTLTGPSEIVSGVFDVSAAFTENVTGLTVGEITVEGGTVTGLSGDDANYTITIEPVMGATVTVTIITNAAQDGAGNGSIVSNTYTIQAGSPASAFEENEEEILAVVTAEAVRGVRSTVSSNVGMISAARGRFISGRQQAGTYSRMISFAAIPLDITGSAELSNGRFSTQGTFFDKTDNAEGGPTRLFFGDFDIQRDTDGSVSAQLNGKLAGERQISTIAMYGYYLGAELGRATLEGAFAGEQDSFGASVGAYFVTEIHPNLYVDSFASLGFERNTLELDNGILNVASDYKTTTRTVGATLTGVIERNGYEFWPQLQLTYGQTHIGMMNFVGKAYNLVDDKLSMDAGSVSMANGTFTAKFKTPLDGRAVSDSHTLFTFAPRVTCERIMATDTTNDCDGGAEIGIVSRSSDGLSHLSINIRSDRVGTTTSTGLGLNFEHAF